MDLFIYLCVLGLRIWDPNSVIKKKMCKKKVPGEPVTKWRKNKMKKEIIKAEIKREEKAGRKEK